MRGVAIFGLVSFGIKCSKALKLIGRNGDYECIEPGSLRPYIRNPQFPKPSRPTLEKPKKPATEGTFIRAQAL